MSQASTTVLSPFEMPKIHSIPMLTGLALLFFGSIALYFATEEWMLSILLVLGVLFGMTLYHSAFGFSRAYRRLVMYGDITGMRAQLVMLAIATLIFAPLFAMEYIDGEVLASPIGWQMILGAFVFGISMQIADGCASGTLYTLGGGNTKMVVTLLCFIAGAFTSSLHMEWWLEALPPFEWAEEGFSLTAEYGWLMAAIGQLLFIIAFIAILTRIGKATPCSERLAREEAHRHLSASERGWKRFFTGPWPIFIGAAALALLNWLTTLVSGAPWGVVSAFSLWGAKIATFFGWDAFNGGAYWDARTDLLEQSVFLDSTSIINMGVILGALLAAIWAARYAPKVKIPTKALIGTIIGGFIMGYSARLAFGCNVGAFFSGVSTFSLHGWVWLFAALPGVWIGTKIRPFFGLHEAR